MSIQTAIEKPITLSLKEKAALARQLSALIDAGLPVAKALRVLLNQARKPKLKQELERVLSELEEGVGLSQAFRRWDHFMVSLLKAAETGGLLSEILNRLARFYEERLRLQTKVITTLTYPLIILFVSLLIFMAMVTLILPQFSDIYERLGGELPEYTRFWMMLSESLRSPWMLGGLLVVGLLIYGWHQNQERYLESIERFLVGVPLVGEMVIQFAATRFARTLGTLLRCGVPITQSLQITRMSLFPVDSIQSQVAEGVPFHQALEHYPRLFPPMLTSMIAVGEETGELNVLLLKAADYYDQELEGLLSRLTALIEPAIILLLGGLIGSVVIGMYLPMFQLFNQIG
jgi:type IV pilus assembly protein PilC